MVTIQKPFFRKGNREKGMRYANNTRTGLEIQAWWGEESKYEIVINMSEAVK